MQHVWENVVASCRACNARKEDRLLHESDLVLRRAPVMPHATVWLVAAVGHVDPSWEAYLGPREAEEEAVSA